MRAGSIAICFIILNCLSGWAQDTLPGFTVTTRGKNKVIVSWTNNYRYVSQISIQRSLDSTRNYKTILTVPDPKVTQNGFVDTKASTPFMFYRLFVVLDSGKYLFTTSKRPFWDTAMASQKKNGFADKNGLANNKRVIVSENMSEKDLEQLKEKLKENKPVDLAIPEKYFSVEKRDIVLAQVSEKDFRRFRDSVVFKTKDTLVFKNVNTILIKPFVPKEVFKPSQYIYTERDGNITISLPGVSSKTYSIRFFEDDNTSLFEIRSVKESTIVLDKSNFLHSGWFRYELYEDGKLIEKHKFYIPKDF